ncbi:hypothetical protein RAD16_10195 [Bradyrhizobium sp. 18BD]
MEAALEDIDDSLQAGSTMDEKQGFAGAADIVTHAETAVQHLKELSVACANCDKRAARRALRQAIGELELARAMLRTGIE